MNMDFLRLQGERLADLLGQAERYFKPEENIKLTLVARSTEIADCFMVMSADDLDAVVRTLSIAATRDVMLTV